jgi:hypothetical protein
MFHRCLPLLAMLMIACEHGDRGGGDTADTTAHAKPASGSGEMVDLRSHDLPLLLRIPDAQTAQADSMVVRWNEDRGWLEVTRGEHFDLRIIEQPGDLDRLKADLERDLVHRNTIVSEEKDLIIYRQEFPADASLVFLHFLGIVRVGQRTFTVESAPDGRFNEEDVRRMAAAVTPSDPA